MEINQNEYPYNLLEDMKARCGKYFYHRLSEIDPKDFAEIIDYIMYILPERSRNVIKLRYQDRKTLREIGEIIGVSRSRIYQIIFESIHTLADVERWRCICQNNKIPKELFDRVKKYKFLEAPGPINLDTSIRYLNLSTWTFNALIRYGNIFTVKDILECGDNLLYIRCLGYKGYEEIVLKLKEHGFDTSMFVHFNKFYTFKNNINSQ